MFTTQPVASIYTQDHAASDRVYINANPTSSPLSETTIHYIEESLSRASASDLRPSQILPAETNGRPMASASAISAGRKMSTSTTSPLAAASGAASPPGMYVRALYDYEADDRTNLSFQQGDRIQVITQLGTGWWDGILHGVRGWFPSNYCEFVNTADGGGTDGRQQPGIDDAESDLDDDDDDGDFDDAYNEDEASSDSHVPEPSPGLPLEGTDNREPEEAAYWIPQATPDGRLFYFNTLTGVSTMELPLETPISASETGPRDRNNFRAPEQSRLPAEMIVGGYEYEEEDTDSQEGEIEQPVRARNISQGLRKQNSNMSNGISRATSIDSIGVGSPLQGRNGQDQFYNSDLTISGVLPSIPPMGTTTTSFTSNPMGQGTPNVVPRSFFEDGVAAPLTWNRLVDNMRSAVERYRMAINNSDRSEYVKRAEDISDHLRLLLAAGSGTTDNHSGQPSIISTNKALYPHFRDMMSKFSKLVLSSHIAATDWPTSESYAKCLHEAEGVLHGVYGYVEVARQQRGEDIPRLVPGFVIGSQSGGNWQSNGLVAKDPVSAGILDQDDYESVVEPNVRLDVRVLERLEDLKRVLTANIRRLDEQLVVPDKIVSPQRHEAIGDAVCSAAGVVVDAFKQWMGTVESINLAPVGSGHPVPQLTDFGIQKQRSYDLVSDLIIGCQAVAGPLGDEWAEIRGDPLEDRLFGVRSTARQLETCASQLYYSLQTMCQMMPADELGLRGDLGRSDGALAAARTQSNWTGRPPQQQQLRQSHSQTAGMGPNSKGDKAKIRQIFGVSDIPLPSPTPTPTPRQPSGDETPDFLRLDLEGEIAYDTNTTPPQLKGGTLSALVEQLTRHDKLDPSFNKTFLLTYRSFTSASELFDLLVKRFNIQPPYGLNAEDYSTWVEQKQKLIRVRVVNILKSWFDNYWMEGQDAASKDLIRRVFDFAEKSVTTTNTLGGEPLMKVLEQRLRGQETTAKRLILNLTTSTPAPIMPKNMKKLKFLDINVTEFARQLTIIESKLYGKIKPMECLNKTWQKKVSAEEGEPAANVKALILHSNQLTNWVAEMILTQSEVKKRVVVIKHFVNVADKCRAMNNFSTLTSIISAFGTAPIHRLKRTWDQVNPSTSATLEQMRALMAATKNFADYREALHLANPPCIPFFGVYLTDLTFIEDGIQGTIKRTMHINFAKRAKTAEVIRDIQQYQNVPYPLQPVPELQEYILSNMQSAGDVHEMYDRSLAVEPREREDEKIAR
ncbi:MAG: hypothetical protein M1825_003256 [Sarcosagium campestre]|nr:MAG: hypothetical protein M1825_003256 [Sarcosagium campestre]